MLVCLFAAFLFFVVRQPANDNQEHPKVARPAATPVFHSVPSHNPASLPLADFDTREGRQAA